jgi:deazaflavin-dependent oxidoreductase (nitroreductase family)
MSTTQNVLGRLQPSVVNPVVRMAWDLEVPIPGDALLETTGRRTGVRRRTPVCHGLEGRMFWLIAQRGRDADWVRNIEANPRVRVKVSGGNWLTGTAHILDDDRPNGCESLARRTSHAGCACLRRRRCTRTR